MSSLRAHTRTTALLAGVISTAVLAGCGSESPDPGSDSPAGAASAEGAFPVTIETAHGEITIEKEPQRIVALTPEHLEMLTVLDEEPVVYGGEASELEDYYPWLAGSYDGDFDPKLWTAEFKESPEAIAAWKPDLILTGVWSVDDKLYEQLSQVAPTYTGIESVEEGGDTSWQQNLEALAALTGHDENALVQATTDYDGVLADAAEKLPGLQGKTFQLAVLSREDQQLWLTEYANGPLQALGLTLGAGQPSGAGDSISENAPKYSLENIDKLTADVVVIVTHEYADPEGEFQEKFEADPRVPELPASRNGTLVYLYGPQWYAVNPPGPASVEWWLPQVLPQLEESALNQSGQ